MSAIAGVFNLNNEPVTTENIETVMEQFSEFPANDIKVWQKQHVFLGCHAQWITPESIGELLPFYDSERNVAITADAIIDNRDDLFDQLNIPKEKRKTMPDSQLILLAYHKWGEDSPKYLIGDFAYMIWDEREHKYFGARDFSGCRTLYYFYDLYKFAFSTTIKPLLNLPEVNRELNEEWLAEFLAITSVVDTVDASITPYKGIMQIPPSHCISVSAKGVKLNRYTKFDFDKKLKLKNDMEYVEAFRDVFSKAVRARLRTYRQVGAHLSGGLDSGSVVSFASKELIKSNKQLHTYSYIPLSTFEDFTNSRMVPNEKPFIQSTVNFVGNIKPSYLEFDGSDSYSQIDDMLDVLEMPYKYFENSFWIKGIFEKASQEGIGILLNGGRGNFSISWGHALNFYSVLLKNFKWIQLFQELDKYSKNYGGSRYRRIPFLTRLSFPIIDKVLRIQNKPSFPCLINPPFAKKSGVYEKMKGYGIDDSGWFSTNNIFELRNRHFEDVFHWNATNTFAAKLSLRYPLWKRDATNDLRVIGFCLSIPEEQYVRDGIDRALIRSATKDYLPDNIRLNQKVRGVQGADWLQRITPYWFTFIKEAEGLLGDEFLENYINTDLIRDALKTTIDGPIPKHAFHSHYRFIMRSIIISRFLKSFLGKGVIR